MAEELKTKMKEYDEKLQIQAEATKAAVKFSQQMKVDQEKGKYKDVASKRAVEFVMKMQFDLQELLGEISPLFNEEGEIKEGIDQQKDAFIHFVKSWGEQREKKNQAEREDYAMANRSKYGWWTAKFYNQDSIFMEEGESRPDLSVSEKLARYRAAETQAKFHSQWAAKFDKEGAEGSSFRGPGGPSRTRWGPPRASYTPMAAAGAGAGAGEPAYMMGTGSSGNFIPGAAFQPPRAPPVCFKCNQLGHMKRECPLNVNSQK